jgi:tetratricopeptide (TPR) repeat protein
MKELKIRSKRVLLSVGALGIMAGISALAEAQELVYPESFNEPMALYPEAMGDFHYPISSSSELAQQYFDQGFQLMFAFAKEEAARSFQAAHRADPSCAVCYWGEAWSWGSYLNGAMTTSQAPLAYGAMKQALAKIDTATAKEAELIRSLQARYVENFNPETRRVQDEAYRDVMAELAAKYADDLTIRTLSAQSLFLLEERRGYRSLEDPNVIRLHNVLLAVLEEDIRHPGACHLLVHATESTPRPEIAAPCAHYLGNSIPGASHINHMPSHTWNEMGLWNDAVRANTLAWHSDQKAAFGKGFAIYPTHNLTMLYYAASMGGESAAAIQAAKDLAKLNNNSAMHAMALIRFGRFDELETIADAPAGEINKSMYDFSKAYGALKLGDKETATAAVSALNELAETTTARFRFHAGKDIVGTLAGILEGEILHSEGNLEGAAAAFRRATEFYDNLNYDEPEPLPFSPRHWLGSVYLELGAYDRAFAEFSIDLNEHPHNIWSLFGAQTALKQLGRSERYIDQDLEEAFNYADIWLRDTKY